MTTSSLASLKCVLADVPSIRCVDGLSGLREALLSDAQRMSQTLGSKLSSKSKGSTAYPSKRSCQRWGYIVDLSGHWAIVFCCALDASGLTAILFDTISVQVDAEGLYRSGILESLGKETSSKFSISFKLLLLAPVSEFRRVHSPASEASGASEAKEANEKVKFNGSINENDITSRLYFNRDCLLPFHRVVIQPVLQVGRDDTCLARSVAVMLWLFSLTAPNDNLQCFQRFLGKAQEFEMEIAVEAVDSNQAEQPAPMEGFSGEPQELEMSPQPKRTSRCRNGWGDDVSSVNADRCGAHDSIPDSDTSALWAAERIIFEPASRLIAADGSPDRFGRETHCMVQSIPETKTWNDAVHSSSADVEHSCRRQQELGKQLVTLGLFTDLSSNDTNASAEVRDASDHAILQAAVERWNNLSNLNEDHKMLLGCRDTDLHLSQVSSHSCLIKFLLYGKLQGARSLSGTGSDVNHPYNLVRIPFSVLPFPKLFERLKVKDFLRESSESELESPLKTLLLRLEVPEKHWGVAVSDFELGGGGSDPEFWNPVSAEKEVRPPKKLETKGKHRGARR